MNKFSGFQKYVVFLNYNIIYSLMFILLFLSFIYEQKVKIHIEPTEMLIF